MVDKKCWLPDSTENGYLGVLKVAHYDYFAKIKIFIKIEKSHF